MALVSLQNISIAFGGHKLLDNLNLQIEKNQRICLLGRNGAGKSTLMKIIHGSLLPDAGMVQKEQYIRVSYLTQEVPQDLSGTAFEIIAAGLGRRGELLLKYHQEENRLSKNEDTNHSRLDSLHEQMENLDVWPAHEEIGKIISRMRLDTEWQYQSLSGGQKRRVLLAAALVSNPDLLLLDEPTNHLDIDAIAWLEEYLIRSGMTLLFVTHDRMLLKKLASRIVELDRGKLADWSCDYDTFLQRKQAVLDAEEKEWEKFDKKLADEEIWIRRGIKARRTRNEGRVRALLKMRDERKQRRYREGNASLKAAAADSSGKLVLEVKSLSFNYDEKPLVKNFNTIIGRGYKIGIIGPNGCGKTTLVNLLLGKLKPQSGTVRQGSNLQIVYFDQMRGQLDPEKSVCENVLSNGDMVTVDGRTQHIITYLKDFLFTPERSKSPVSQLSGGERNRLLLARLFTKPANVLVFDEPTNDLDAETLELLEELLVNFKGTVLLISHDRAFLNNIVSSTFVFEGQGRVKEYIGGYDDWLLQKQKQDHDPEVNNIPKTNKKKIYQEEKKDRQKKKLSYKETQELKELPASIEAMEEQQKEINSKMADPGIYRIKEEITGLEEELKRIEARLQAAYARWEYLESLK